MKLKANKNVVQGKQKWISREKKEVRGKQKWSSR